MNLENMNISIKTYAKLKRFGCTDIRKLPDFQLKKLKKRELIELFNEFSLFFRVLDEYEQVHTDDQVLINEMDKEINKLLDQRQQLISCLEKADEYTDKLEFKMMLATMHGNDKYKSKIQEMRDRKNGK